MRKDQKVIFVDLKVVKVIDMILRLQLSKYYFSRLGLVCISLNDITGASELAH